jgi:hypothetical protein
MHGKLPLPMKWLLQPGWQRRSLGLCDTHPHMGATPSLLNPQGMIGTSFYALRSVGVAMVTVWKNVSNFITAICDVTIYGKSYSAQVRGAALDGRCCRIPGLCCCSGQSPQPLLVGGSEACSAARLKALGCRGCPVLPSCSVQMLFVHRT